MLEVNDQPNTPIVEREDEVLIARDLASADTISASELDTRGEAAEGGQDSSEPTNAAGMDLEVAASSVQEMQLYALSWRNAATGILTEIINFAARDEADLLDRFNAKVPRHQRLGPPGKAIGSTSRRVLDDNEDSLQWAWQPHGLSLSDITRDLGQLCIPVSGKR